MCVHIAWCCELFTAENNKLLVMMCIRFLIFEFMILGNFVKLCTRSSAPWIRLVTAFSQFYNRPCLEPAGLWHYKGESTVSRRRWIGGRLGWFITCRFRIEKVSPQYESVCAELNYPFVWTSYGISEKLGNYFNRHQNIFCSPNCLVVRFMYLFLRNKKLICIVHVNL